MEDVCLSDHISIHWLRSLVLLFLSGLSIMKGIIHLDEVSLWWATEMMLGSLYVRWNRSMSSDERDNPMLPWRQSPIIVTVFAICGWSESYCEGNYRTFCLQSKMLLWGHNNSDPRHQSFHSLYAGSWNIWGVIQIRPWEHYHECYPLGWLFSSMYIYA
jgi:hypothetical protein